ncbi:YolD-like family protein [Mycoplasmatota bacterium WC44]
MSDRGMMKWNSFNALIAHGSNIEKMMLERKKIPKPILSYDQLEELNELISLALLDEREVEIVYYHLGYILIHEGLIKNVDLYKRELVFSDINIKLENIVGIKLQ